MEPDPVVQTADLTITRSELDPRLENCPVFDIRPAARAYKGTIVYLHGGKEHLLPLRERYWS